MEYIYGIEQVKKYADMLSFSNMTFNVRLISHEALTDKSSNKSFVIANNIKISELYKVTKKENLYWKNSERQENIYIYPTTTNTLFDFVYLDDITKKTDYKAFLGIQTSDKKYQAYYRLTEPTTAENIKNIQKYLQEISEADPGGIGAHHNRRIPGFYNTKYKPPFFVKIIKTDSESRIDTFKILETIEKNKPKKIELQHKYEPRPIQRTELTKSYNDFATENRSEQDFKYIHYLIKSGRTNEEIRDILFREAEINERKGTNGETYIEISITKARANYKRLGGAGEWE